MKNPSLKEQIGFFFKGHGWNAVRMVFFYVVKHSPVLALPIIIARLIDLTSADPKIRNFKLLLYGGLLLVWFIQNIFTQAQYIKYQSRICRGVSSDLRTKLCRSLQQLSILYHSRNSIGRLQSKIIRDVEMIETVPRFLTEIIMQACVNLAVVIVTMSIRAPFALLFLFILVPLSIVIQRHFKGKINQRVNYYRSSLESMNARLYSMMTMVPITRAHGLEEEELSLVRQKIDEVARKGTEFDMISAWFGATSWVTLMCFQSIFLVGSVYLNFKGRISTGDIVMFNSFFAMLANSFNILLTIIPNLSQVKESMDSVCEVLNAPDLEFNEGKESVLNVRGAFEFKNVSFRYPGLNHDVLNNISFSVEPKQSVAFVGPSGCGKSTLLYLLLGFVRPTGGKILLDGRDMNELDLRSYRDHVGVVTQEMIFFPGTVRENVAYGKPEASDDELKNVLQLANAWEFVERLPNGLNTRIGEDGINLSRGQKQRLAIARALIRDPEVLIFDEATSSLDVESEKLVQDSLRTLMRRQTTFIVSHKLTTLKEVNKIIVIESGQVNLAGSHDELMRMKNFYSLHAAS